MDQSNTPNPGPKFDPITGELITPNNTEATPSMSQPESYSAPTAGQEFRVATGGPAPDMMPSTPPSAAEPSYSQTAPYTPIIPGTPPLTTPYSPPQYTPPVPPKQVNVNQPKRGSALPMILGALALLLVAGGVGAYFLLNRAGIVGSTNAAIERALPVDTLGYFSMDPNPGEGQRRAFDRMREAFESQPGYQDAINKLTGDLRDNISQTNNPCFPTSEGEGINVISNYLGDAVTFAVLSPSSDDLNTIKAATSNGEPGEIVDVAGRNIVGLVDLDFNPLNKKGPLADIKKISDEKVAPVETYNGTEIRKYSCEGTDLYFGLLSGTNTAIVGANVAPVKRIIDSYKEDKGLKSDTTYQYLAGKVPGERVATMYVNLTKIYEYAEVAAPDVFSMGTFPKGSGGMLMTLSGQDDGLQMDVASHAKFDNVGGMLGGGMGGGIEFNPEKRPSADIISDIPAQSLGFFVGTDIKTAATSSLDALKQQDSEMFGNIEADFKENTGLDLRTDVLAWMGGDFALSVGEFNLTEERAPQVVFQLKLGGDDRAKATDALGKLMEKLAGAGSQDTVDIGGNKFYAIPNTGVVGVTGDRLLVVVDADSMSRRTDIDANALVEGVTGNLGKGLGTTDKYKEAQKHFPANSNVMFYMDAARTRELVEAGVTGSSREEYDQSAAPFLRPFKYVLIGSSTEPTKEANLTRSLGRIFIGISK